MPGLFRFKGLTYHLVALHKPSHHVNWVYDPMSDVSIDTT